LHKFDGAHQIDGDFNDDGAYDVPDIDMLTTAISTGGAAAQFDLSGDGQLSMDDVNAWLAEAGEFNLGSGVTYLPADGNLDGVVDGIDFVIWNSYKFTNDTHWSHGDFNADGVVDGIDFVIWNDYKFTSADFIAAPIDNSIATVNRTGGSRLSAIDGFFSAWNEHEPTRAGQLLVGDMSRRVLNVEGGTTNRKFVFPSQVQTDRETTDHLFAEMDYSWRRLPANTLNAVVNPI
jgi:hypothetical protein